MSIAVGDKAPDFTLTNQDRQQVTLSDSAGELLQFYPHAKMPLTCTIGAVSATITVSP